MSGIGGEEGEMEELLAVIKEARDDVRNKQNAEKEAKARRDEEKERLGNELVEMATTRRGSSEEARGEESSGDEEQQAPRRTKKAKPSVCKDPISDDIERFAERLRDADMAKISLERERLALERDLMAIEREEREKERAMRREELDLNQKQELEKFKLMLEVLKSNK